MTGVGRGWLMLSVVCCCWVCWLLLVRVGCWLVVVGWLSSSLVSADCCLFLMVVVGCCWLLCVVVGCWWWLLVIVGSCWL